MRGRDLAALYHAVPSEAVIELGYTTHNLT